MQSETRERLVQIFMNDRPFDLQAGRYSGLDLKAKTNVPTGDVLYRIEGKARLEISDGESVEIHEGEHFVAVPGHGGAG